MSLAMAIFPSDFGGSRFKQMHLKWKKASLHLWFQKGKENVKPHQYMTLKRAKAKGKTMMQTSSTNIL